MVPEKTDAPDPKHQEHLSKVYCSFMTYKARSSRESSVGESSIFEQIVTGRLTRSW